MSADGGLQRYRRGLVRAKSAGGTETMREGNAPELLEVEWYALKEEHYKRYFQLFNDLHRICGVGGDDFEVEEIEPERLVCVIKTLKNYPREGDRELDEMVDRMWGLCFRAEKEGQPVFLLL